LRRKLLLIVAGIGSKLLSHSVELYRALLKKAMYWARCLWFLERKENSVFNDLFGG
jgi:hypothetical protein